MLCIVYNCYICAMDQAFIEKWKSQVKKGTITFILLNLLTREELYGYELIEKIKAHTDIAIAEGTLYPMLNRLKEEQLVTTKWVEQSSGIPRKYYSITQRGLQVLSEMKEFWNTLGESITKISA